MHGKRHGVCIWYVKRLCACRACGRRKQFQSEKERKPVMKKAKLWIAVVFAFILVFCLIMGTNAECNHNWNAKSGSTKITNWVCRTCGATQTTDNQNLTVRSDATCTEGGKEYWIFDRIAPDGKVSSYGLEKGDAAPLGHSYGTPVAILGDCKNPTKITSTCERCGYEFVVWEPADPDNHANIRVEVFRKASCTEGDIKHYICDTCGKLLDTKYGKPLGHDYEFQYALGGNCKQGNTEYYTCKVCGDKKVVELPVNPDSHCNLERKKVAATCTKAGSITTICTDCKKVLDVEKIPALGHDYGAPVGLGGNCIQAGTETYTCKVCGDKKVEKLPINPDDHCNLERKKVEATCTKAGSITTICRDCKKELDVEKIPALGHDYGAPVALGGNCIQAGTETYTCKVCGDKKVEKLPINPDDHCNLERKKVEATCTKAGSITTICRDCKKELKVEKIPALGHDYEFQYALGGNCKQGNTEYYTCKVCGDKKVVELPVNPDNHASGKREIVRKASCQKGAVIRETCMDCGKELGMEYYPALPHKGAWVLTAVGSQIISEYRCINVLPDGTVCNELISYDSKGETSQNTKDAVLKRYSLKRISGNDVLTIDEKSVRVDSVDGNIRLTFDYSVLKAGEAVIEVVDGEEVFRFRITVDKNRNVKIDRMENGQV
ncbi:MAG: acetone carboxylase subunit gamma [Clostridia bacterium]|nr:acetone carboxylase subunit gamma [Clostridia bacterium]